MRESGHAAILGRHHTGDRVPTTRVVLVALPPLLRDIVRATLNRDPDVRIVAEVDRPGDIGSSVDRDDAHVAVFGIAPSEWAALSDVLRDLFAKHPHLTIIALASDGRSGYVYRLEPRGVVINDISPSSLVRAIRSHATMDVHPSIHPLSAE